MIIDIQSLVPFQTKTIWDIFTLPNITVSRLLILIFLFLKLCCLLSCVQCLVTGSNPSVLCLVSSVLSCLGLCCLLSCVQCLVTGSNPSVLCLVSSVLSCVLSCLGACVLCLVSCVLVVLCVFQSL